MDLTKHEKLRKYKNGDKVTIKTKKEIFNSKEYKKLDIGKAFIDKLCNRFNTKTLTIDEWAMDLQSKENLEYNYEDKIASFSGVYTTKECDLYFEDWLFTQE